MAELPPIWFLRHGQTEWNLEGRLQGHKDSPLTALGRSQAARQARILPDILQRVATGAGGCFASPLGRAQETARIALAGRGFVTDPRLSEIATGDWEGRLRAEVATGEGDLFLYAGAPGGEGVVAGVDVVRAHLERRHHRAAAAQCGHQPRRDGGLPAPGRGCPDHQRPGGGHVWPSTGCGT